jgi:L-asparaginase II
MGYAAVLEVTRGEIVESLHHGAVAISASNGTLEAWCGDPGIVTYMRSSAKPLQALCLIESGAAEHFDLTAEQLAIVCASHDGTDDHAAVVISILDRIGLKETDLHCGVHRPFDRETAQRLRQEGRALSPLRNNCSGKHAGMLASATFLRESIGDYEQPEHPVQRRIRDIVAEMCGLEESEIAIGVDGCTVPTFGVSLYAASTAFARLVDPNGLPSTRVQACNAVVTAMTAHPFLVAGSSRFDTRLMRATNGRIVSKAGAEGFQALGIRPGCLGPDSPGLGVAIKIADGDYARRARSLVSLEVLRLLEALSPAEYAGLVQETAKISNNRGHVVGALRPTIRLLRGVL